MFDLKDMGNMMKLASAAGEMQEKQERLQQENLQLLKKISAQLEEILVEIRSKRPERNT